jgi:hypothetical protein
MVVIVPDFDPEKFPAFDELQRVARTRGETLLSRKKEPQTLKGVKSALA